jgi:hypothetical protein
MKYCLLFLSLNLNLNLLSQEPWIKLPSSQWPTIALSNHVLLKNGDRYIDPSIQYAGTGFLITNGTDTFAATAKHVLWVVKNKTNNVQINNDLQQWVMLPRGTSNQLVVIDKLINEDSHEILRGNGATILERDWIIFSVKTATPNIHALKPRYTPIKPGEKVYIISNAYQDSITTVHEGKVLNKLGMDMLIDFSPHQPRPGASGSPIIDSNGYLIGIHSSNSSDGKTGKQVAVAISTEYLNSVLNNIPSLNASKKDYGELIFNTVITKGVPQAIKIYHELASDPNQYYVYNLRSASKNGLRETGERLIAMNLLREAIEILELNVQENKGFYIDYNLLAKAYLLKGKKKPAIKYYKHSTELYNDRSENEAFKELEKLGIK